MRLDFPDEIWLAIIRRAAEPEWPADVFNPPPYKIDALVGFTAAIPKFKESVHLLEQERIRATTSQLVHLAENDTGHRARSVCIAYFTVSHTNRTTQALILDRIRT